MSVATSNLTEKSKQQYKLWKINKNKNRRNVKKTVLEYLPVYIKLQCERLTECFDDSRDMWTMTASLQQ